MTEVGKVYRCNVCGNIVEVLNAGKGTLVCCGRPMEALAENTVDASREKHVPVVSKIDGGYKVAVGSASHPMEEKHFIEWIELVVDGRTLRQRLQPGMPPEAVFPCEGEGAVARAYCNLHGLWKSE